MASVNRTSGKNFPHERIKINLCGQNFRRAFFEVLEQFFVCL
jgi:hypothetical protein